VARFARDLLGRIIELSSTISALEREIEILVRSQAQRSWPCPAAAPHGSQDHRRGSRHQPVPIQGGFRSAQRLGPSAFRRLRADEAAGTAGLALAA
jgi:hypothetical protein